MILSVDVLRNWWRDSVDCVLFFFFVVCLSVCLVRASACVCVCLCDSLCESVVIFLVNGLQKRLGCSSPLIIASGDRVVSVAKSGGVAPWHFSFRSSIKMLESQGQRPIQKKKKRVLQCTVFTAVRSLQDASCRHDSSRSFALLEHSVRPGGRRGSQQHQLFCTSQLFPPGALGGRRPLFDMPSSAHGSTHEFSCEKSLCTHDKRLNRQHVCSIPMKRTCCGTHLHS